MFLFVYDVAMYYIPYSFLPPIAAVITLEGFARVAVCHAEAAEHGDHADAAQAGEVRATAGGAFREVVERIQPGFVALDAFTVCLFAGLIFFFVEERVVVIKLFTNYFSDLFGKITIFYTNFKCLLEIIIVIFSGSL